MGFHLSSKKIPGFSLGISLEFSASFFRAEKTIFLAVLGLPVVFRSGKWKFNQLENPSEKKGKPKLQLQTPVTNAPVTNSEKHLEKPCFVTRCDKWKIA
jgi:hypothetical protein